MSDILEFIPEPQRAGLLRRLAANSIRFKQELAAGKAPYGDVSYADPGYQADKRKRYPIDSEEHVRSAWSYINHPHNEAQYTPQQVADIKARIRSAAKKFGVEIG